ncbi:MAG TPA: GNAT family N-acetyltransferase [Kofleriaceae bacterium]|nr:GNAT family N-acetyltransferase [Kofleriaceae bacterium]
MTAPRFFSLDYLEHAVLQDGTAVQVRLIRPDDKDILRAGFERLSPASRYARFLAAKQALSDDELTYLCEVDHENHVAIGAVLEPPPAPADASAPAPPPVGLAIARFIRLADPANTAEAAIAVADEAQHRGLGRLLFMRLVAAAAERGIERFRCEVLGSNAGMAGLLAQISPERSVEVGGGMMSIEIALPNVTPTEPPAGAPTQSGMYHLFRAVAANAVEWTGVVRNLWRR